MSDPAISKKTSPADHANSSALLKVEHLKVLFPVRRGVLGRATQHVHAVDDVSLSLRSGETLGVVGESGCGKTTLIRCVARLTPATDGRISFAGHDITDSSRRALAPLRAELQMVFQDPHASLNPRRRVAQILATPLRLRGVARADIDSRATELLERVGMGREHLGRFPHEFSGGQRQRIGIARALAMNPRLILLDEPVSALDVSIQAQVINLLSDLQAELALSYVFVAHDLAVVRHVSDRIAVMYLGKVVEQSPAAELYVKPVHPYTQALLAAIPIADPRRNRARTRHVAQGEPPSPVEPPAGCRFHPRCAYASDLCRRAEPPLLEYPSGHLAACHHPLNVTDAEIAAARISPTSPRSASEDLPILATSALRSSP
jgi:oligopeptide/dipeptide ABC transporter ATP-binding protein